MTTMFHLDFSSKRSKLALRFFTYGVMTLATIVLTAAAIFYAMGYRFNQSDLSFEQGGLLQMQSTPSGAKVYIDSTLQSANTPMRANLSAGTHTVELQSNGYVAWQKTFYLAAGQVLWLDYGHLLPTTINTSAIATIESAVNSLASPDHKWSLVQISANQSSFKLVNYSSTASPKVTDFTIPDDQLTKIDGAYGAFAIKEWDLNSRYILVEHVNGETHELLRLDRENAANTVNISRTFSLNISEVHFAGSNANKLYAKTDSVLRSLDISSNSASAVLVSGLESFVVYDDDIVAFVALHNVDDSGATQQKVVGIYSNSKETDVKIYPSDTALKLAYTEYSHHAYLAINSGGTGTTILRDPTATNQESSEIAVLNMPNSPVGWMNFNSAGRILAVGNGNEVATYDLELDSSAAWTISGAQITKPLRWLDDYYFWTDAGGMLKIFEYDGNNERDITSVIEVNSANLSTDGKFLYSIGSSSSGGAQLQSSRLITD